MREYNNMNILITGAAGYIGGHVVKQLLKDKNVKVTVVDNLCSSDFDSTSVFRMSKKG